MPYADLRVMPIWGREPALGVVIARREPAADSAIPFRGDR
jgi:hypothetical protein